MNDNLDGFLGNEYVEAVNSEEMGDEEIPQMDDIESVNIDLENSNKSIILKDEEEIEPG